VDVDNLVYGHYTAITVQPTILPQYHWALQQVTYRGQLPQLLAQIQEGTAWGATDGTAKDDRTLGLLGLLYQLANTKFKFLSRHWFKICLDAH
jgi:hypothetical protein